MATVKISQGRPSFIGFETEPAIGISKLGTPILDKIVFPEGEYEDANGFSIAFNKVELDDCLITVNRQRNVSITNILGREGTVKEFISNGDYEISFNGRIVAYWQFQPTGDLQDLSDIFNVEKELTIYNKYLNEVFGITDIVIVGKPQFNQVEGSRNTYTYSFRAISYQEITLEVLDNA